MQCAVPLQTWHAAVFWNNPGLHKWPGMVFACSKICDSWDCDRFSHPAGLAVPACHFMENYQPLPVSYSISPGCLPLHTGTRAAMPSGVVGGRMAVQHSGEFPAILCACAAAAAAD